MSKVKDIGIMEVMEIFDKCLKEDYDHIMETGRFDYEKNREIADEISVIYDRLDKDTRKLLDYVSVLVTHVVLNAYAKGKIQPENLEFLIAHYCVMVAYRVLEKIGVV